MLYWDKIPKLQFSNRFLPSILFEKYFLLIIENPIFTSDVLWWYLSSLALSSPQNYPPASCPVYMNIFITHKSSFCCLGFHGCVAFHWSVVNLEEPHTDSLYLRSHQLWMAPQLGVGAYKPSKTPCWNAALLGFVYVLYRKLQLLWIHRYGDPATSSTYNLSSHVIVYHKIQQSHS